MKKFSKKIIFILVFLLLLQFNTVLAFAHSGGTDSQGGHNDNINGGYHYHHGYPAHQHPNGKCPYNYNNSQSTDKGVSFDTIIIAILVIGFIALLIYANFEKKPTHKNDVDDKNDTKR